MKISLYLLQTLKTLVRPTEKHMSIPKEYRIRKVALLIRKDLEYINLNAPERSLMAIFIVFFS
jgi:hypothetical protein